MAANYLPVLLSSVNVSVSAADDSDITRNSHVSGQVDYLSHRWREEDVWRSWRSMTRQKNELANGLRLENASWRTWWQQRNRLKTVSPETLNWLKDSDVTWLYGPFHTSLDPAPPPLRRSPSAHLPLRHSTPPPSPNASSVALPKSILKHRSVSQLLASALPTPSPKTDLLDVASLGKMIGKMNNLNDPAQSSRLQDPSTRPLLLHTRSETNILDKSPFRNDSPPRILAEDATKPNHGSSPSPSIEGAPLQQQGDVTATRKHISFNTFVEQCIAIEKPSSMSGPNSPFRNDYVPSPYASRPRRTGPDHTTYWDRGGPYLDEEASDDECDEGSDIVGAAQDSDEDDDPIEIKPRSRSSSHSLPRAIFSMQSEPSCSSERDEALSTSSNNMREHVTIAPIAPTLLKTSSSSYIPSATTGNSVQNLGFRRSNSQSDSNSPASGIPEMDHWLDGEECDVPLLWVPPVGRGYERDYTDRPLEFSNNDAWVVTPPEVRDAYTSKEREGRTRERQRERTSRSKVKDSLSPAEDTSSSTTPSSSRSRSRSRSRNRHSLLSPSPDGRERGRSSRSRSRSDSSARDEEGSPDVSKDRLVDREEEGRGRRLKRTLDNRGAGNGRELAQDMVPHTGISEWDDASDGQGRKSIASHVGTGSKGSEHDRRRTEVSESDAKGSMGEQTGAILGGRLAGIRGYIGSILGS